MLQVRCNIIETRKKIVCATDSCLIKILRISGQTIIRLDSLLMIKFIIFIIILLGTEDIHIIGATCVENERYFQKFGAGI